MQGQLKKDFSAHSKCNVRQITNPSQIAQHEWMVLMNITIVAN